MKTLVRIIRKELKVLIVNRALWVFAILIQVLMFLALLTGHLQYQRQAGVVSLRQEEKRTQWLEQSDKHPHIAAHYGTFVFKPATLLSLFDAGLNAYTGTSVYLEAHYRHEFMFRPAQDQSSMIRFGQLTAAMVLQVLVPLFIIFITFSAFTAERKNGTLKLIITQGVSLTGVVWGKIWAVFLAVVALLVPAILLLAVLGRQTADNSFADAGTRSILLLVSYGIYLFIFVAGSVLVSYWSYSGRQALLTLLFCWILLVILVPRTVANLSENHTPLPSMREFKAAIEKDMLLGVGDMPPRETYYRELETEYLTKYGKDSVWQLPVNFAGIRMQAGEDYGNRVHGHHLEKLRKLFYRQNRMVSQVALVNPYLSVRNLSMMLSGTDLQTTVHFEEAAEAYRQDLVRQMNLDMAKNSRYGEFYEYKAGRNLWENVADFSYKQPLAVDLIKFYRPEVLGLFCWALLMVAAVFFSTVKTQGRYE